MDKTLCPPLDLWADYHRGACKAEEERALSSHLEECDSCRQQHQRSPRKRKAKAKDHSLVWSTVATALFAICGFSLVVMVSLQTPRPVTPIEPELAIPDPLPPLPVSDPLTVVETIPDAAGE